MPWLDGHEACSSFFNKLQPRYRALIEKVRVLIVGSSPSFLLLRLTDEERKKSEHFLAELQLSFIAIVQLGDL